MGAALRPFDRLRTGQAQGERVLSEICCQSGFFEFFAGLLRAEAGSRPGGRGTFLCFAKEKYPKERRPCCLRPLRYAAGQPGVLRSGVRRGTRFALRAPLEQPRRVSSRSVGVSFGTPAPPRFLRAPGAYRREAAKQPHGPSLRSARNAQALRAANARPSAAMARVGSPLLAAPAAGRLRGGMRVGARMLRCLTRRICPNEARQRVVSYAAHPASAPTQVCPAGVADSRVALSLLTFFRRSERK